MNLLNFGAFELSTFCGEMKSILRIVGYVLFIFKIAIPLVIIAYGMFDFGKAVVAQKEDEIKTQTKRLIFRFVAGIVIFFIPHLVIWLFGAFVDDYSSEAQSFKTCETCFLKPNQCR